MIVAAFLGSRWGASVPIRSRLVRQREGDAGGSVTRRDARVRGSAPLNPRKGQRPLDPCIAMSAMRTMQKGKGGKVMGGRC
jgi:hypothetical protein